MSAHAATDRAAPNYVLVTPARDEASRIHRTLEAVAAQTRRPLRWVVVDDGSTDRTGAIIDEFASRHPFVVPLHAPVVGRKSFGSKARAFAAGLERLAGLPYDYIGNLDADVSMAPDYFERLLGTMAAEARLGLAGGLIVEQAGGRPRPQRLSAGSVAGAVQMFRRACFEEIGGYLPLERGGIDAAAEIMARMHGWQVRTLPELHVLHHGPITTGSRGIWRARFNGGLIRQGLGYHPLFQIGTGLFRMSQRPYVIGGLLMLAGYFWGRLRGLEPQLPPSVVAWLRAEQSAKLRRALGLRPGRG